MPTLPAKLYHPTAAKVRVAVVSAERVHGQAGAFLLRLARGERAGKLSDAKTYGPYAEPELSARADDLIASLRKEGYADAEDSALRDLFSADSAKRGRAALRLGWRGGARAVDALLAALPKAVDEVCPILDALGTADDRRAIDVIRPHAARKLLSRRRSAVEALRNLGDADGLAEARARTLEQLPESVRVAVAAGSTTAIVDAVKAVDIQRHGLVADLLYELAEPAAVAATRTLVGGMSFNQPFVWRYVKSILKRAMLRRDHAAWGWLQHAIERQALALSGKPTRAVVKSGYDGAERETTIFARRTRDYVRRAGWRHLRTLAKHRPDEYAPAAAEALIHYSPDDERPIRKRYGAFADAYLFNRVLYDAGKRLEFVGRSMRYRFKNAKATVLPPPFPGSREERFADLWDRRPDAYVRLLAAARLVDVHQFAHAGLARPGGRAALEAASVDDVLMMLDAPYEPTVALALDELDGRFDPTSPEAAALMTRLAGDARPAARALGQRFLRETADRWTRDADAAVKFLTSPQAETRALAADLTIAALTADATLKPALAARLLAVLRATPAAGAEEDAMESVARVCREALADELAGVLTTADLLAIVERGTASAKSVAGDLLARRPDAADELGLERLVALANHPLVAVRTAAVALLRGAEASWRRDPSPLFALVDAEWPDTRAAVLELIRTRLDFDALGASGILGLLDSNRPDVQDSGVALARQHFAHLDAVDLARRLSEHPHPHARPFALELVTKHLPTTPGALAALERFFRTILLDTRPTASRTLRRDVIALLLARGLADPGDAAAAVRVLGEAVRFQGRADFERALDALVRLKLAHPSLDAGVTLPAAMAGGVA